MFKRYNPISILTKWRDLHLRVHKLERSLQDLGSIIDVLLSETTYKPDLNLGMNGQIKRKEVIQEIFDNLSLEIIVETGAFRGASTGYFATQFSKPVYSCELIPRNYHITRRLLRDMDNVRLQLDDSRSFLRHLGSHPELTSKRAFFYLDAHWYDDLPLADEIDLIAPVWKDYVILVDDFEVIGDSGYQYDDYGPGKALTMAYIQPLLHSYGLTAFYPKAKSSEETGKKRGYVVIVPSRSVKSIGLCKLLRLAPAVS